MEPEIIDVDKLRVAVDGSMTLVEPEKVIPVDYNRLQREQNEDIQLKVMLEKQLYSLPTKIDDLTTRIAKRQLSLDDAAAKNPDIVVDAEPALIDEPPAVG